MLDIDRYVDFIIKHKLTQGQFLLLYFLYLERGDLLTKYKKAFPTEDNTMIGDYMTKDLIRRKFIEIKESNGEKMVILTSKFSSLFIDKYDAAEELINVYPAFIFTDKNVRIPLTLVPREKLVEIYHKATKGSQDEHKEIIRDIKFGKKNDFIKGKLDTFIESKQYLAIRKERLIKGKEDTTNTLTNDF